MNTKNGSLSDLTLSLACWNKIKLAPCTYRDYFAGYIFPHFCSIALIKGPLQHQLKKQYQFGVEELTPP